MRCAPVVFATLAVVFITSTPLLADTVVNLGTVSQFTGPADLNLDPANVIYAINFSNDSVVHTVGGVMFSPDVPNPTGTSLVLPNQVTPWQTKPEYGATADDDNLEAVMQDIRWANSGAGESLQANLNVTPGKDYRLQLLISGNGNENRRWDIQVEGMNVVDEITSLGEDPSGPGVASYDIGRSTLYELELTAIDSQINVVMGNLFGNNDGGDRNPIWQGLILSEIQAVPEPTSLLIFLLVGTIGIAGASVVRRRRRRK